MEELRAGGELRRKDRQVKRRNTVEDSSGGDKTN